MGAGGWEIIFLNGHGEVTHTWVNKTLAMLMQATLFKLRAPQKHMKKQNKNKKEKKVFWKEWKRDERRNGMGQNFKNLLYT